MKARAQWTSNASHSALCDHPILGAIASAGAKVIALVPETKRAFDLAIALDGKHLAVMRCVEEARPEDHVALATMLTEGDFVWAAVVSWRSDAFQETGLVETFHVSDLNRLSVRLLELREAFDEAR